MTSYGVNFGWGLLFLLSLAGWGRLVAGREGRAAGWGLHAAWGMAAWLALGGPLLLLGWANREVLIALTVAGCLVWLVRSRGSWRAHPAALAWSGAGILLVYAPQVVTPFLNPNDDFIAYLPFIRGIQETGSLLEPFSLRRLAAYGGQSLLQAAATCFGDGQNSGILDAGLAPLMLAGLAWAEVRRRGGSRGLAAALAVLAVAVPQMRRNLASQATGAVLIFALYRTLALPLGPVRRVALTALLAAGAATLRQNYLAAAAVIAPLAWLIEGGLSRAALKAWLARTAAFAASATLLLGCWMLLLYRSSGSALYPLWRGYQRVELVYADPLGALGMARWVGGFFLVPATLAFLLPAVLVLAVRRSPALLSLAASALLTSIALLAAFTRSDYYHLLRYSYAVMLPLLIAAVIEGWGHLRKRTLAAGLTASAALACWGLGPLAFSSLIAPWQMVPALVEKVPLVGQEDAEAHRALDSALPRDAGVLAVVPAPFLLSFREHRLYLGDLPGQAGPPPGVPIGKGPEELKQYLRHAGIEYIAYADFDRPPLVPEYSRALWKSRVNSPDLRISRMAPDYLDFMRNLDALRASEQVVAHVRGYYLLRFR